MSTQNVRSQKRKSEQLTIQPNSKQKKVDTESQQSSSELQFMSSIKAFVVSAGIQKMRLQIFETQLKKYGGTWLTSLADNVTHIIVDDNMNCDRMCRILKIDRPSDDLKVLKSTWLSACFRDKELVDCKDFLLDLSNLLDKSDVENFKKDSQEKSEKKDAQVSTHISLAADSSDSTTKPNLPKVGYMFGHQSKRAAGCSDDEDSDYCPSDGEACGGEDISDTETSTSTSTTPGTSPHKILPKGNWVCAQSSKTQQVNCNKQITDKLEEMVRTYESTNDKWRAFGYQKAIQVLKKQSKPISTFESAMSLPGIGKRLAEKIWEIAESGELRKLNELKSGTDIQVIEMFKDVWGAGPTTARAWYQQGLRTLDDLRTKANLTHQQKIGLQHYDDILDRMPRSEAGEIEQVVVRAAESLQDGIIAQACGSYRRGKATCGDVDVLVTHPDGKSHKGIFPKLLAKLKQQGFLTDDLVTAEDEGNQKKYLGMCRLPGDNRRFRRIDIIVVPYDEYACALVYFTGSAHFNRSLRHLAKKMGMSLSEHSLNTGVVRNGAEKTFAGTPVSTPTEESVLVKLGVPYRPPEERDH